MKLKGKIIQINQLLQSQRIEMFSILSKYFNHVSMEKYEKDLTEKNWVILLSDDKNMIRGFSTHMLKSKALK